MTGVSIIMPAHNAEATLAQAVHSVQAQSYRDWELIVCDDASTDGTASVMERFEDRRIVAISNSENLGPGLSRNRAMERASGRWIAFLDADDAWSPRRLERLLAAVNSPERDVVFDDIMISHQAPDGGLRSWKVLHGRSAFGPTCTAPNGCDVPVDAYIRAERLLVKLLFPAHFIHELGIRHSSRAFGEDAEFVLRLVAAGGHLRFWPEPLYYYRITPGSITGRLSDDTAMRQCLEACRDMTRWPEPVTEAFDRKIEALRVNEALYALYREIRKGRWRYALMLVRQHPALLRILPKRLVRRLHYHLHRLVFLRQPSPHMERQR